VTRGRLPQREGSLGLNGGGVIDLGVSGKPICDFLLVINCNFIEVSATVFKIITLKDRKLLILPTPHFGGTP